MKKILFVLSIIALMSFSHAAASVLGGFFEFFLFPLLFPHFMTTLGLWETEVQFQAFKIGGK